MNPITQTRIYMSEHSYPTPTRNHLSMHNREAAKRKVAGPTKASEVRFGIRKDGVDTMAPTATEAWQARKEELVNLAMERAERKAALIKLVHEQMAETDNWANKS